MKVYALISLTLAVGVLAQNCGPKYNNKVCDANACCSQYGWCDTDKSHCDPATCLSKYSGAKSSCAPKGSTGTTTTTTTASTSTWIPVNAIPVIDVCGAAHGISCPGAGPGGYFYRCCSKLGHCGPKNSIQDQASYCGAGCQGKYGKCDSEPVPVTKPTHRLPESTNGMCGPIVGKRCPGSQCCSGSNYCGTGKEFCGSANWCQVGYGRCESDAHISEA